MAILVVDDSASTRQLVSYVIEDIGRDPVPLVDGQAAVEYISTTKKLPSLIVMDVQMPGMDGYEAASQIKEKLAGRHIPIVFLTASDDETALERCLSVGDDFVKKPFSAEVLMARIKAHLRTVELYRTLDRQADELKKHKAAVESELRIVNRIFDGHLDRAQASINNLQVHISSMSAFNGDVMLSAMGPTGSCYLLVGDVTGHGLPAAVAGIPAYGTFRTMASKGLPVGTIAYEINAGLRAIMPPDMMMAALVAEISPDGCELSVWSGGMPAMPVVTENREISQHIVSTHLPLSVLPPEKFSRDISLYRLMPGDRLYLYTDGVEECSNDLGEMFGEDRVLSILKQEAKPFDALLSSLEQFRGQLDQNDDVTLVEYVCAPIESQVLSDAPKVEMMYWAFEVRLDHVKLKSIDPVPVIARMLSQYTGLERLQDAVSTVLSELYVNSLDHGLLLLDSSIKDGEDGFIVYHDLRRQRLDALEAGWIDIRARCFSSGDGPKLVVELEDSGEGFDFQASNEKNALAFSGRGIGLVEALCSRLEYGSRGNKVRAEFDI